MGALHNAKTIITVKGPANVQRGALAQGPAFYCQGWLRHLRSPTPLVWHNGGTIGPKAVVGFTPDGDLGLVVLSNLDGTDIGSADVLPVRPLLRAAHEGLCRRLPRRCQGPGRVRKAPGPPGGA